MITWIIRALIYHNTPLYCTFHEVFLSPSLLLLLLLFLNVVVVVCYCCLLFAIAVCCLLLLMLGSCNNESILCIGYHNTGSSNYYGAWLTHSKCKRHIARTHTHVYTCICWICSCLRAALIWSMLSSCPSCNHVRVIYHTHQAYTHIYNIHEWSAKVRKIVLHDVLLYSISIQHQIPIPDYLFWSLKKRGITTCLLMGVAGVLPCIP